MLSQSQGLFDGLELSVNLPVAQLSDPDLVGQLHEVLLQTGMPPHQPVQEPVQVDHLAAALERVVPV